MRINPEILKTEARNGGRFLRSALAALVLTACTPNSGLPVVDIHFTESDNAKNLPQGTIDRGVKARVGREIYTTQVRLSADISRLDQDPGTCLIRFFTPNGKVGNYKSFFESKPFCQNFDAKPYLVSR